MQNPSKAEETGTIGRAYEQGKPVIYAFVDEFPPEGIGSQFPWLTVVSWEYDGSKSNGMPDKDTNAGMRNLEDALTKEFEAAPQARWAYNRTGNGRKEFVYYIADRALFTERLNIALQGHPRHPININFYEDPEWTGLKKLLTDFSEER